MWGIAEAKCILVAAFFLCLRVCLSVSRCMPTLLHGPGCNLGNGRGASGCALLGGFAVGVQISLLWQHSAECEMSASACTRSVPGCCLRWTTKSNKATLPQGFFRSLLAVPQRFHSHRSHAAVSSIPTVQHYSRHPHPCVGLVKS